MRGRAAILGAIVLLVLAAALIGADVSTLGNVLGWTLLVLLVLVLVPVLVVAFFIWRVKRKMRKAVQGLHTVMAEAQRQALAQQQMYDRQNRPGGVIDVEPTSVKDETR